MSALIRLYPPDWRSRYEDEFRSLLAERPPDVRDRVDIVRGALDARIRPHVRRTATDPEPEAPSASVSSRALGASTLAGGILWLVAMVVAINGPVVEDDGSRYRDGAAAIPFTIAAFLLLGAGLVGVARRLPYGEDVGGLAVALAAVTGSIWACMPWVFPLLFAASVGYIVLAISARRSGVMGRPDAALLVGGVVLAWIFVARGMLGVQPAIEPAFDGFVVFWIVFTTVWVAVGHTLLAKRLARTAPAGTVR
jgi:hypothetical protein